jgi:hypothetical protein
MLSLALLQIALAAPVLAVPLDSALVADVVRTADSLLAERNRVSLSPTWERATVSGAYPTVAVDNLLPAAYEAPPLGDRMAASDTVRRVRAAAIEYSDFYNTRLTIHRIASFTTIPLFVAQYFTGRDLYAHGDSASAFARNFHRPLATAITGLFVVNTVTGVWNLIESGKDPAGRTRRNVHSILMMIADAGFTVTGIVAADARNDQSKRDLHRNVATASMGVALVGYLMMYLIKG